MGFQEFSTQGLKIINRWSQFGRNMQAGLAEQELAKVRSDDWKSNSDKFRTDPTNVHLSNWILDDLRINFEWDSQKNEFKLKPVDFHVSVKDSGLKAFQEAANYSKYHELGRQEGYRQYREDTIEQLTPAKEGETPQSWLTRYKDIEKEVQKMYLTANDTWAKNLSNRQNSLDEDFVITVESKVNPDHELYDPNDSIDPSTPAGVDQLAKLYEEAPGEKSKDAITGIINYDLKDANYSIEKHKQLLDAEVNDPVGYMHLLRTINSTDRKKYASKGVGARILESMNTTMDEIEDKFETSVINYVIKENLNLKPTLHESTQDQIKESTQTFYFRLLTQAGRLEEEFGGDIERYGNTILKESLDSIRDTSLNPIIEVGSDESFSGQESIVFAKQYKSSSNLTPKTYEDWRSTIMNSYNNESQSFNVNIQDLIDRDEILNDDQTLRLRREIESGGGGDNTIFLSGDIQYLAALDPKWSARKIINATLEKKGLPHRLPPDKATLLRWSGYNGSNPYSGDYEVIQFMNNLKRELDNRGIPLPRDQRINKFINRSEYASIYQPLETYNPITRKREPLVS